jgi:predicted dehydrogenase
MLTAAVIGCGRMGAEPSERLQGVLPAGWLPLAHAECLQRVDGVRLVALVDVDEQKLARHGKHYGVDRLYPAYQPMLDAVRPDLLTIATRTPEKADIVRCASEHGVRGLYIEKPFANSLQELHVGLSALQAARCVVGYGVNRRYHAIYRRARAMLQQGAIGEVVDITVELGRSQLLWAHPHSADLLLFLAGDTRVEAVQAFLAEDTVERNGDRIVDSDPVVEHAHFVFASGVRGTISRAGGYSVRVGGTAGTLTVHGDGSEIQLSRARGKDVYFLEHAFEQAQAQQSATVTALEELAAAVRGSATPSISTGEIATGLHMLLGCVWSHLQGGTLVRLQDVPHDLVVTGKFRGAYA